MQALNPSLSSLFAQLGLPAAPEHIQAFIDRHAPLAEQLRLDQAPFWSAAQAAFLGEQNAEDAEWSEIIDQLDLLLRRPR